MSVRGTVGGVSERSASSNRKRRTPTGWNAEELLPLMNALSWSSVTCQFIGSTLSALAFARRCTEVTYLIRISIPGPEVVLILRSMLEVPQIERCRQWLCAHQVEREPRRLDEDVHVALIRQVTRTTITLEAVKI